MEQILKSQPKQAAINDKTRGSLFDDQVVIETGSLYRLFEKLKVDCCISTTKECNKHLLLSSKGLEVKDETIIFCFIVEVSPKVYKEKCKLIRLFTSRKGFTVEKRKKKNGEVDFIAIYSKKGGKLFFNKEDVEMIE